MNLTKPELDIVDTGIDVSDRGSFRREAVPAPFYAATLKECRQDLSLWEPASIGIFSRTGGAAPDPSRDTKIGEYTRNYPALYRTFHPFRLRGRWLALYSEDYTATSIMSLPDCKRLGGEEPDSVGFCPVDFHVPVLGYTRRVCLPECPRYVGEDAPPDLSKSCTCKFEHVDDCPYGTSTPNTSNRTCKCDRRAWEAKRYRNAFLERSHGFVAGCVWGDDSSWKVQYLELSRADEGILQRDDRFGYVELGYNVTLDKAIDISVNDGEITNVSIALQTSFELSGKPKKNS